MGEKKVRTAPCQFCGCPVVHRWYRAPHCNRSCWIRDVRANFWHNLFR
ncbi:hypothetical protein ACIO7M_32325 [Streptomyces toxytricini]|uniref:DUF2256 domain-containing protein n=1 Tax=Streptomyces toxytricini TaxID=67369 RepID=A0ABW8ER82_STRT5